MARLPRYVIPGQAQHIIHRGNNRQAIFASEADYQYYRDAMIEAAGRFGLAIHAYVLMSNHIHLLATPTDANSISKTLQSVGRQYVQHFNKNYRRSGTPWEGRYRATVIDSEQYMVSIMRYIELNPVRAGLVEHPRDYPWSSHRRYAYGEAGANLNWLIEPDQYRHLARTDEARKIAYRNLFKAEFDAQDLAAIRDATHKGWALGGNRFRQLIEGLGERRAAPAVRGRPRKTVENGDE